MVSSPLNDQPMRTMSVRTYRIVSDPASRATRANER